MALQRYANYSDLIRMEIELLQFYHYLIVEELQRIDLDSNLSFLKRVRNAYSKYSLQNCVSDISFDNSGIRSAYIFSYAPCFSSSVIYHFLNLIHSNPWILKKAIAQESLTISCLGGGPAVEVIAIAKALEMNLKMFCLNTKPVTLYVNIIDIDAGWKKTMKLIIQNWWKFFNTDYIKLKLYFVQFDLMLSLSEEVQNILKRSDLITMVNFISAVYGTNYREKISTMFQEIVDQMKDNGVIFYVNCSRFSCMKELSDVIATSAATDVIYGPFYNDVYQLSEPCLHVCYNLYARHFGREPPTVQSKSHVVAWRKIEMQEET